VFTLVALLRSRLHPTPLKSQTAFYAPTTIGGGHNAFVDVVCRLCPVPSPKWKTEGHRKLKIGKKEAHETGDPS